MNDTQIPTPSNIQAAIDAGRALGSPILPAVPQTIVVIPKNYEAVATEKVIEPYLASPRRTKVNLALLSVESFIEYVAEFKTPATHIFTSGGRGDNLTPPFFTAILDYHVPGTASWCEHRANFTCRFTEEWNRWMNANRKRMSQSDFATFLEENQSLVVDPPGAELLEFITNLEGHNIVNVSSSMKLQNGKAKLMFDEDVELKGTTTVGQMEVPLSIKAQIEMFDGSGVVYAIPCRLKYRVENRKIIFWFEAVDVHLIIKNGVADVIALIKEKLLINPLFGTP